MVNQDVVFVEDAMQPLLSCTKETNVCSQDMYDTLLPLFSGRQSHVEPNEACIQPNQVSNGSINLPINDVCDALDGEIIEINESRTMLKWRVQTFCNNKLDAPLPSRTCYGSQHVSYAFDYFTLAVSSMFDEEEPICFDEAQHFKNWMATM